MNDPIYQIDFDKCRPELSQALRDTQKLSKEMRSEFLTPEHLFFVILHQETFLQFCVSYNVPAMNLQRELAEYLDSLDKIPKNEKYFCMPSIQMKEFMQGLNDMYDTLNRGVRREETSPLCVSDALTLMYDLNDSMVQYLIEKYLTPIDGNWSDYLYESYHHHPDELGFDEIQDDAPVPQQSSSAVEQEVSQDKKKVKDKVSMSKEDIHGNLMASMGRLMGALGALGGDGKASSISISTSVIPVGMIGVEGGLPGLPGMPGMGRRKKKSRKGEPDKEPWEELVTKIDSRFLKTKNPLIGRKEELLHTIRILNRKDKNNPIFIGEPGVGKTAMIYGLAPMLEDVTIYQLDMGDIIAGASYHGEYERRMKEVFEGAKSKGNCIIYIDEIHTICETGGNGSSSMSATDLMKPYLEDGSIRFIGSTTYKEYNKTIANNKAFARRFGTIDIKEPSVEETIEILADILPSYEKHHRVRYDKAAIRYAVEQSHALINDRYLPDKAIDIMDEAGSYRQQEPLLNKEGNPKAPRYQKVDKSLIKKVLTEVCRIDAKALSSESNDSLKDLDKRISSAIYGQDESIKQVVRSVMMSKAGLTDPDKPIASLLFVGPTGVGKTEVCKVLAREMGMHLIRFDMSEYTEKHTISKLIGSPAGYVGYDEGGLLTDAIRKTPNCVLLLDEIEKAHEDIYNILLQVMDYAKLTDNKGNKVDFKNVILIMTSNAGAQYAAQAGIGFSGGQSKGQAMLNTVKKTFKPEFLNRLTGTVVFNEMDSHMASLILDKKLAELSDRLEKKNVTLTLSKEAHEYLLKKGFTQQYGAREMDRVIQQHLIPLLMDAILFGSLKTGGSVTVLREKDQLILHS